VTDKTKLTEVTGFRGAVITSHVIIQSCGCDRSSAYIGLVTTTGLAAVTELAIVSEVTIVTDVASSMSNSRSKISEVTDVTEMTSVTDVVYHSGVCN
jgi:hypothetical protein